MMFSYEDHKLAELVGILLGDGCISLKSETLNTRLKISFNSKDDLAYIYYVANLLKNIFDIQPILKFRKNENTADLFIFKKEVITVLIHTVGLKLSSKWGNAKIPNKFLRSDLSLLVLRGYFDTDGCLVVTNNNGIVYPRLEMKICPSPMQNQFVQILKNHNFKFGVYQIGNGMVRIQLNGKEQLIKWVNLVGFGNTKHFKKAEKFL